MSVFGFPRAAGLPGLLGNPGPWLAATSIVLAAAAIGVGLPYRTWRRKSGRETILRSTALAILSPVVALPIGLGVTDPPIIALICLALACANRSAARRYPAETDGVPSSSAVTSCWITWTGLAAVALGTACAMKATAWPVLPVMVATITAQRGMRAAARFTAATTATAVLLIAGFAPALTSQPRAFTDNIIAYPLGLTHHLTPAASPLPGHLLASTGTAGHLAAIGLLLLAGAVVALSLAVRPPRDVRAATLWLALGLILLFTLAPAARFGYFSYPAALLGWLALTQPRRQQRYPTGPNSL
jgi:hypothetical protein